MITGRLLGQSGWRFTSQEAWPPGGLRGFETSAGSDRIWMPEFQGVVQTRRRARSLSRPRPRSDRASQARHAGRGFSAGRIRIAVPAGKARLSGHSCQGLAGGHRRQGQARSARRLRRPLTPPPARDIRATRTQAPTILSCKPRPTLAIRTMAADTATPCSFALVK